MRPKAALLILLASSMALWTGCKSTAPSGTVAVQRPPTSPLAEESAAAMSPVGAESTPTAGPRVGAAGYAGEWMRGTACMRLNADGTGELSDLTAAPGAPQSALTWAAEGDHVVLTTDDATLSGTLAADGASLSVSRGDPESTTVWTRAGAEALNTEPFGEAGTQDPEIDRMRREFRKAACLANIRILSTAMLMYVQDYDQVLPAPSVEWDRAIGPYVKNERLLLCPSDTAPPSYSLNPSLLGRRLGEVRAPAETAGIFESDDGRSVVYRHEGGSCLGLVDGNARWLKRGREGEPGTVWDAE